MGPMIAAGLRLLHFCPPFLPGDFQLLGQAQLITAGVALLSVYFYPDLKEVGDCVELLDADSAAGGQVAPRSTLAQRVIVCGSMVSILIRAMVTSGVEGATSLLLETEYMFP